MTPRDIAACLNGTWNGRQGLMCCPAHADVNASLSVAVGDNGRPIFHCHAGCDFRDVIAALEREGVTTDTLEAPTPPPTDNGKRSEIARRVWGECVPAKGTLVEDYLQSRGITLPLPACLRFSTALQHRPSGGTPKAMVAALQDDADQAVAIHRTYLKSDGQGKADIPHNKMALGPMGSAAVKLAPAGSVLGLAEGIETALSAMQLFDVPTWAVCGARFHKIYLPSKVRKVVIFADQGLPGKQAAERAAKVFTRQRRQVDIRYPETGDDFNDQLRGES